VSVSLHVTDAAGHAKAIDARSLIPFNLPRATRWAVVLLALLARGAIAGPFEDRTAAEAAYKAGDYATALRLISPLANQGDASAQFNLGLMYENGRGVPQDYAEAAKWFGKAAEQGDASAQFNLSHMYYKGLGVPQDYAKAAEWVHRAADQGDAKAQTLLGYMYVLGQGVPQDYVLAHMWLNLGASLVAETYRRDAVMDRDKIASKMTPAQIAEAQKLAHEWKPKLER
jgi:TPR repeat protein